MANTNCRKRQIKTYLWEEIKGNKLSVPRRTRFRHSQKKPADWDSSSESEIDERTAALGPPISARAAAIEFIDDDVEPLELAGTGSSSSSHDDHGGNIALQSGPDNRGNRTRSRQSCETTASDHGADDTNDEADPASDSTLTTSDMTQSDSEGELLEDAEPVESDPEVPPDEGAVENGDIFPSDLDVPLFPGAQITRKESLLMIMAHFLHHSLTQNALDSLLQLLHLHLPSGTAFPASKYLFNKHFEGFCGQVHCHVYCSSCEGYIGKDSGSCPDCGLFVDRDKSINSGNYFLTFETDKQIQYLLQDPNIQKNMKRENCDLSQGRLYRQLPMGEDDLSVTWGSDGAAIFSSSNFSIWPLLLMVNELPYPLRRKHILMGGLWFGSGKPKFPSFLKPIVEDMNTLSNEGISWEDQTGSKRKTRVFPGPLACDSVARCQLQDIMQFNGKHGCSWCLHPGESVQKGNGYTRAYPLKQMDQLPTKRDEHSFKEDARQAVHSKKRVHGVKGPSMILLLLHFNIVSGFVVDYMHTVCLGVGRTLTYLWLESTGMPFYIGNQVGALNERLSKCKPPSEVTRLTRTLTQRKFWKAHEWRSWLFHYSPIVTEKLLPLSYYKHWMCFVTAVFTLMQTNVDSSAINQAEMLLLQFVLEYETLYGIEYITYNVHQLIHMADSVRNWGPLWSISCFAFESMNHKLNRMISGTQYVQKQIARKFLLARALPHVALDCFQDNINSRNYFEKHIHHFQVGSPGETVWTGKVLKGIPKLKQVRNSESQLLHDIGFTQELILGYDKISWGGVKVTTEKYTQKKRKRVDCYVSTIDGNIAIVKKIFLVCLVCNTATCTCTKHCYLYLSVLNKDRPFFRVTVPEANISVPHKGLVRIKGHKEYKLCTLDEFHSKCLYYKLATKEIVSILPNNVELD